ncbi:MAG: TetR/AcrR family transcriptional regulator [Planctomycetota bacterium]|jgi:AcrR family transcriptional regulator
MAVKKRRNRKNRKEEIISAALSLVAKKGLGSATIRAIASLAGVTEGAIYRHFPNKESLIRSIYQRIVLEMVNAKERIAGEKGTLRQKIRDWVNVTYEYYDEQPDAFIFLYLTPYKFDEVDEEIIDRQGEIFMKMIQEAQTKGEARPMKPELALSHFTGIELNVPRLIHEGRLAPGAQQYIPQVVDAILRVIAMD